MSQNKIPDHIPADQVLRRVIEHICEIADEGTLLEESLSSNLKTNYRIKNICSKFGKIKKRADTALVILRSLTETTAHDLRNWREQEASQTSKSLLDEV